MYKKKGFTLIELLTVIAIIGILASIIIVNVSTAMKRGRDARRKEDMETLRTALEMYYEKNLEYPKVQLESPPVAGGYQGASCVSKWCVSAEDFDDDTPGNTKYFTVPTVATQRWITGLVEISDPAYGVAGGYLSVLPLDPVNKTNDLSNIDITASGNFFYLYKLEGPGAQGYKLMTKFEDDLDSMANDGGEELDLFELFTPNAQSLTN